MRVEPCYAAVSGWLWWREWSTWDALWLFAVVDGNFSDSFVPADVAEQELRDWAKGRDEHYGEVLRAEWLTSNESDRLRQSKFGVDDP